jgi:hypothetical protein
LRDELNVIERVGCAGALLVGVEAVMVMEKDWSGVADPKKLRNEPGMGRIDQR